MAWTLNTVRDSIGSMSEPAPSKKSRDNVVTFQWEDMAALKALLARFPGVDNDSQIFRTLFKIAMPILAADPTLVLTTPTPTAEEMTAAYQAKKKAEARADRMAALDPDDDSSAAGRSEEIRGALDDARRDKKRKGPPPPPKK